MKRKAIYSALVLITAGCGTIAVSPGEGTEVWEMVSGGVTRTVLVHPPSGGDGDLPVLIAFHGGYGTASGVEENYGISRLADREGFIAVYPQGLNRHWLDGREDPGDLSDVHFIRQVVDSLESRFSIASDRIYATGMSNGAIFCHFLAVNLPGVLAGIAPVCGGIADPGVEWFSCSSPLDVLVIQGTDDPLVPYNGGEIGFRGGRGRVLSTAEAVSLWREVNDCSEYPLTVRIQPGSAEDGCEATMFLYSGIRDVSLVRIDGGGHAWPGGGQYMPQGVIGRECTDLDGAEFVWRFFTDAIERKTADEPERSSETADGTEGRV